MAMSKTWAGRLRRARRHGSRAATVVLVALALLGGAAAVKVFLVPDRPDVEAIASQVDDRRDQVGAFAADFVVAGASAYFLQAFINIGLVPDAGANWLLPRFVGRARAAEMMMLGERVPAATALEWGLVNRVVENADLMTEALAMAHRLAAMPTKALGLIRRLANETASHSLSTALGLERVAQREAGESEDFRTGVTAFLGKTKPEFSGR